MDWNVAAVRLFISFSFRRTLVSLGRSPSVVTVTDVFSLLYILFVDLLSFIGILPVLSISGSLLLRFLLVYCPFGPLAARFLVHLSPFLLLRRRSPKVAFESSRSDLGCFWAELFPL